MTDGYLCTESRFLDDVKNHGMSVVVDNGFNRHLIFSRNGSMIYRFELITWAGKLCITGDCGTYVFSRLPDMFEFFRMDNYDFNKRPDPHLSINPGYWGEKLLSVGTNAGYTEFDKTEYVERVAEHFNDYFLDRSEDERKACWREVSEEVIAAADDGEHEAYSAVQNFEYGGFSFQDFFDSGGTEQYTFHYIWCLYAIAHGIRVYDAAKSSEAAA